MSIAIAAAVPLLLTLLSTVTLSPESNGCTFVNVSTSQVFTDDSIGTIIIDSWMTFVVDPNFIASKFVIVHPYAATVQQSTITSFYDQPLTAILSYNVLVVPSVASTFGLNVTSPPLMFNSSSSGIGISSSYSSSGYAYQTHSHRDIVASPHRDETNRVAIAVVLCNRRRCDGMLAGDHLFCIVSTNISCCVIY
jgi:hypothetical protein